MTNRTPRVSIGLPVYNGERFLTTAIESILAQSYTDFELIISDNASTDGTETICRDVAGRDPRVRFSREEQNRGAAWNFNHTFRQAKGEYFRWAAADDISLPDLLAETVEVLDARPDVVWTHCRTQLVDEAGAPLTHREPLSYAREGSESRTSRRPHRRLAAVLLGSGGNRDVYGLIRTAAMRRTSLQLPYYGADKVFIGELCLEGRYHEIPKVLFLGRIHAAGSGALASAEEQQEFIGAGALPRRTFTRIELLRAHGRAIRRADLSTGERLRCHLVLARYLLQVRKWPSVVAKSVRGSGTGGGYVSELGRETGSNGTTGKEPA